MIRFIVFGLVVGSVARLLLPGKQHLSIVATLIIGVLGSVVGGVIANALGRGDLFELNALRSVVAVLTAFVLIVGADVRRHPAHVGSRMSRCPKALRVGERPR